MTTVDEFTTALSAVDQADGPAIAQEWLSRFADATATADPVALRALFVDEGYWRDCLAFTWDLRTLQGVDRIVDTIAPVLSETRASDFELEHDAVEVIDDPDGSPVLQATFRFTTSAGTGRGVLRLVGLESSPAAWILYTSLESLHSAPEPLGPRRARGSHDGDRRPQENWSDRRRDEIEFVDGSPVVVIVGAGQGGLALAARLKMLGVETLIVERAPRVGDSWRNRYHSLVLHDPVYLNHLPYLPFPEFWPVFTPKDKLANWFESYVDALELNVWTGSELVGAEYHDADGSWDVQVRRPDGSVRALTPRHVVLVASQVWCK